MPGAFAIGSLRAISAIPAAQSLASLEPYARLHPAPARNLIFLVNLHAYIDPGAVPTAAIQRAIEQGTYANGYNHRRFVLIASNSQVFLP